MSGSGPVLRENPETFRTYATVGANARISVSPRTGARLAGPDLDDAASCAESCKAGKSNLRERGRSHFECRTRPPGGIPAIRQARPLLTGGLFNESHSKVPWHVSGTTLPGPFWWPDRLRLPNWSAVPTEDRENDPRGLIKTLGPTGDYATSIVRETGPERKCISPCERARLPQAGRFGADDMTQRTHCWASQPRVCARPPAAVRSTGVRPSVARGRGLKIQRDLGFIVLVPESDISHRWRMLM